ARRVFLAAHGNRRAHAEVEVGNVAVEQLAAHAIAIRLEEVPAIHEVRHGNGKELSLVGAAIVGKAQRTDAESRFPQRLLARMRGACAKAGEQREGESVNARHHSSDSMCLSRSAGLRTEPKRSTTRPCRSSRNFVKFHLMRSLPSIPRALFLSQRYNGCASS